MVRIAVLLVVSGAVLFVGCADSVGPSPEPTVQSSPDRSMPPPPVPPREDGPVAHYPLDGQVTDIIGNAGPAVVYGGMPGMDRFGDPAGAFEFDGVDDWVDTGVSFDFGPRTVAVWFRVGSLDGQYQRMFVQNDASLEYGAFGMGITAEGFLEGRAGGNEAFLPGPFSVEEGRWYHLALVLSGTTESYYIDGELLDTSQAAAGGSIGGRIELVLGATRIPDRFFHGRLDDLRIYDRALSVEELQDLYDDAPGSR